jgi:hypothetical protein
MNAPVSREVKQLLARLGTAEFAKASAALAARGADGGKALLRALSRGGALGSADANGRAVMEDLETQLVELAHAHPEVLVEGAAQLPALTKSFAFVSALSRIPSADAAAHLVVLLDDRDGAIRWLALEALLRREDPRAIAHLAKATRDRDSLVVFAAVVAMRRWSTVDDVPRLLTIARSPKTAPGTREAAYDAIESICARGRVAAPEGTPPARLVEVALPAGARVTIFDAQRVAKGDELARVGGTDSRDGAIVPSPCDGVVIDVLRDAIVVRRS